MFIKYDVHCIIIILYNVYLFNNNSIRVFLYCDLLRRHGYVYL